MAQNGQLHLTKHKQIPANPHFRHQCTHSTAQSPPTIPNTPSLDHHAGPGERRVTSSAWPRIRARFGKISGQDRAQRR